MVNPFDQKSLQLRLESMKLSQSSLQQLMTLSAGGLAIFFGLVSKASFIEPVRMLGVLVVLSWVVALCASAIAHRLIGGLFISLCNISLATEKVLALESQMDEVVEDMAVAINQNKLAAEANVKIAEARSKFELESKAFELTFFPSQDRVACLTIWAFSAFVFGFVALACGYVAWAFSA
jgi:hypothetical protein